MFFISLLKWLLQGRVPIRVIFHPEISGLLLDYCHSQFGKYLMAAQKNLKVLSVHLFQLLFPHFQ
jgi:hypothetical protein